VSSGLLQLGKSADAPVLTGANGATVETKLILDYSGGGVNPAADVNTLLTATYANNGLIEMRDVRNDPVATLADSARELV